jgi:hypothetical protein
MRTDVLTRETVTLLTQSTGHDYFVTPPSGFVRIPGGYISTHEAMLRVLAGKLDPVENQAAVAREDFERTAPERASIIKAKTRERVEAAERQAAGIARAKATADRKTARDKQYVEGIVGSGMRTA